MPTRSRTLRKTNAVRDLVREFQLTPQDLLQPYFVIDGKHKRQSIASMPGIDRLSIDLLLKDIEEAVRLGLKGCLLFGLSAQKDLVGRYAYADKAVVPAAVKAIKKHFPQLVIVTDVCLCAYLSHGHCGLLKDGHIDNDATLPVLTKMAVSHAMAGADFVAPSDMMDFRVKAIREGLDKQALTDTGILSYAVKYASAYYGPFRDAAHCAPGFGDRKSYQMDPANAREALKEAKQDINEGADMVMVKPAMAYLDIISLLRQQLNVPIVAYNVSGEYSLVKAGALQGWVDEKALVMENLLGMKRAGADIIISYHTKDVLRWMK